MAAGTGLLEPGAVFHADRGSNYTSDEFGRFLTGLGIRRSVGRTGICYDCEDGVIVKARPQPATTLDEL
jgi:transposase InsO family protein